MNYLKNVRESVLTILVIEITMVREEIVSFHDIISLFVCFRIHVLPSFQIIIIPHSHALCLM